jgi:dephospho-CoA kinase
MSRRPPSNDGLFIVGIVGQAGSGKTTVARALERDGAVVIDADALGHEVVDQDPEVRAALAAEYGADVYGPAGLDRARVAAVVFRDAVARERLNRLVHPRIVERMYARLGELEDEGYEGVVVLDAALLLDWRFERECDAVLAVMAPRAKQLERLRAQRGWSADEADLRIGVQRPAAELSAAADVTIDNGGAEADLERLAHAALRRLRDAWPNRKGNDASSC